MQDLVFFIEPSLWNVLKYLLLAVVVTPILEILLSSVIASRATLRVRNGSNLELFDSRLGVFALHSNYSGAARNRLWLILCAAFILGAELALEYSFSSDEIQSSAPALVWIGPNHRDRYLASANILITDEPTRIVDDMSRACIQGPRIMNRTVSSDPQDPSVVAQYSLSGAFKIRRPYEQYSSSSIVCGGLPTVRNATFLTETVVDVDGVEGFESGCRSGSIPDNNRWFEQALHQNYTVRADFQFGEQVLNVSVGDSSVCVGSDDDSIRHLCLLTNGSTIALAIAAFPRIVRCIPLIMSGEGVGPLFDTARSIRLLAHLMEKRILTPPRTSFLRAIVPKFALEEVIVAALIVGIEEGVVGLRPRTRWQPVLDMQTRQVTTMSRLGLVPLALLALFGLVLACWDIILRIKIWKKDPRRRPLPLGLFLQKRIGMSKQWVLETVNEDLTRLEHYAMATEGVCVREHRHEGRMRLRVLPDSDRSWK